MDQVRQAHLPGNYELYDENSGLLGPPICKVCWEDGHMVNSSSLDTVWLRVEDWEVVWWLCRSHHGGIGAHTPTAQVLRSEEKVVRSPAL